MAQAKDAFQSTELSPDQRMQVDRLFDLLVNLNIIAPSPASLSSVLPTVIEEPAAIEPPLSSHTIPVEFDREELSVVGVEQLSLDFDRLPDDSKITELKTSHLDQGDQSPELLNLLIPWVAELLDRTVSESQAEVIQAFSPIVDRLLEDRISKNQASIGFALAPVISPAISKQILIDSNQVSTAIAPVIGDALKKQIEIEQDSVIDALYPVIGGTISKYLAETIRAINQQIENSVSVDGIKRKIRAKMQGVSEAELILREAIPFTVQAIFLIQKSSGLIVADIQCTDSKRLESDMIAGMLTAIRSFANDCIVVQANMMHSDGVSELNEIDYGASKIILEVAGYCYLAIVVWGEPPKSFLPRVRKVFRDLIQEYGTQIEHFEGDLSTIPEQINTQLETLRNFQAKQEHSDPNKPSPLMLIGVAVVGLIAIPWGFFHYRDSVNRDVEKTITTALLSTPELAVYRLNAVAESGKLKLVGQVPNLVLRQRAEHIVSGVVSRVAPQWSIDNHITAVDVPPDPVLASAEVQRVAATLNQTLSTAISARYAARQVLVEGKISQSADAQQITRAFARIPGVQSVSNTVQVQPLQIETRFYFEAASATLNSADLVSKIPLIKSFLNQQATVNLKIIGHSRSSGSPIVDQDLALRRANVVRDALIRQGTDPRRLQAMGTTHLPPGVTDDQSAWLSRCVVLEVIPMATLPPKRAH